jgi:hypothetical protein
MNLALATFAVESIISFLAKVHGQSVIGHGQSLATDSGFQRPPGGGARPAMAYKRRLDDRW